MPEWSIGTVSKTVVPLRVPRVRIPLFPQKRANQPARFALFLSPHSCSSGKRARLFLLRVFPDFATQNNSNQYSFEISLISTGRESHHRTICFLLWQTYPQAKGRREGSTQGENTSQKHGIVRSGIAINMEKQGNESSPDGLPRKAGGSKHATGATGALRRC